MLSAFAVCALLSSVSAQSELRTGFDDLEPGAITLRASGALELRAEAGHAEVDAAHGRSGEQCLHLLGGEERTVELRAELEGGIRRVEFWGERWTSREPFALRLEAWRDSGWRSAWDGKELVRVGRSFKSHVVIDLGAPTARVRLVATSPEGTGVLIDDLRLSAPRAAEVTGVRARQTVRPVLLGKAWSPLIELEVEVRGNQNMPRLQGLSFELKGVAPELVAALSVRTGADFRGSEPVADTLTFEGARPLKEGINRFWLALRPSEAAGLDSDYDARVTEVLIDGSVVRPEDPDPAGRLRVGVALRDAGDGGVHTYRIPALVRTPKGTLIATYDLRYEAGRDLPGHIDVGFQRSTDGGRSWSPMGVCLDMGEPHDQNGVGDPCSLVDPETGRVFVFALWSQGNRAWNGSGPGLSPEETGQVVLTTSDDDGLTWSPPRNLTRELKDPEWRLFLQSPGDGMAMADGTLVCPAQYRDAEGLPWSTVIVSRDHGETWTTGTGARPNTTESRVVEVTPGVLMLNMRDNRGGSRAVTISRDLGRTWEEHASSRGALPEPVCNAGMARGTGGRLWFMNPAVDKAPRRHMTLKASDDGGLTWPHRKLLFEPTCAGYPSIVFMGEHIGALYEGGAASHLIFERVSIGEVLGD